MVEGSGKVSWTDGKAGVKHGDGCFLSKGGCLIKREVLGVALGYGMATHL